jgi:hypothetical protein
MAFFSRTKAYGSQTGVDPGGRQAALRKAPAGIRSRHDTSDLHQRALAGALA